MQHSVRLKETYVDLDLDLHSCFLKCFVIASPAGALLLLGWIRL